MKFNVIKREYEEIGSAKCFVDYDNYGRDYYIPRSQVKILSEDVQENGVTILTIEIPNWIIRKNNIPVFNLTRLILIR